jgi:hypothetical protein
MSLSVFAQTPKDAKPTKRYNAEPDLLTYPQGTPKETLTGVLKTIEANKINYLLAQLADPQWVDKRVKEVYDGKFETFVAETSSKFNNDRASVKELQRFLLEGMWEMADATASAQLKDVPNRRVYLRKIDGRWFLESRQTPTEPTEK